MGRRQRSATAMGAELQEYMAKKRREQGKSDPFGDFDSDDGSDLDIEVDVEDDEPPEPLEPAAAIQSPAGQVVEFQEQEQAGAPESSPQKRGRSRTSLGAELLAKVNQRQQRVGGEVVVDSSDEEEGGAAAPTATASPPAALSSAQVARGGGGATGTTTVSSVVESPPPPPGLIGEEDDVPLPPPEDEDPAEEAGSPSFRPDPASPTTKIANMVTSNFSDQQASLTELLDRLLLPLRQQNNVLTGMVGEMSNNITELRAEVASLRAELSGTGSGPIGAQ